MEFVILTKKQNQLLSFLIKRIEEEGISPSYEEICMELSLKSKSGIHRIVKSLEERGYIERLQNKARAIAPKKHTNGQPYISNVINLANKFLDKKSNEPNDTPTSNECFALNVEGDSMIDEGIYDGDTIIINKQPEIKNGDIIVALIDKEEATLKKFRKKGDSIALEPANKNYKTQIYGPDRITIQGKMSALIRKY